LGFIVEKVKGKLYVYEYAKLFDGAVVEKYVGSLEEIVRLYQATKASYDSDRGYQRLKPRELKRIAQCIADNLMEI